MKILFGINLIQFQMIKKILLELTHFTIILVLLALMQHQDLLDSPLIRLEQMQTDGNFLHPFLWAFGVYFIVLVFRLIVNSIMRVIRKR